LGNSYFGLGNSYFEVGWSDLDLGWSYLDRVLPAIVREIIFVML